VPPKINELQKQFLPLASALHKPNAKQILQIKNLFICNRSI